MVLPTKEEINEAIFNQEKTMNALKKVDSSTKDDNSSFFTFLIPNHDMKAINTNKIIFVSSPVLAVEDCFLSFLVVEVKKEEL